MGWGLARRNVLLIPRWKSTVCRIRELLLCKYYANEMLIQPVADREVTKQRKQNSIKKMLGFFFGGGGRGFGLKM